MKKNRMMRIACSLMIAVLLTTSVISGTFAKYVTQGTYADQARVAKFGVVLAAEGHLFDYTYKKATDNTPGGKNSDTEVDYTALSVVSNTNVVAPGTKNTDGMILSISGAPEVDVRILFTFANVEDVFLKAAEGKYPDMTQAHYNESTVDFTEDYYPIVYTVEGNLISTANEATLKANNNDGLTVNTAEKKMSGNLEAIVKAFTNLNGGENGTGYFVDANTDLGAAIGSLKIT